MDRHEHQQLNEAQDSAGRAARQGTELKSEIKSLEAKLSTLATACQAMWELLRDKSSLTEEQIQSKIEQLSGQMGEALQCPQCGRQVSRKKNRCLFCGIEAESDRVFDV
jgi:hypothetical protein